MANRNGFYQLVEKGKFREHDAFIAIGYVTFGRGKSIASAELPGNEVKDIDPRKYDLIPINHLEDYAKLLKDLANTLIKKSKFINSRLEQLAQSLSTNSGRGPKPKRLRKFNIEEQQHFKDMLKAGYSISNPVKGLNLTRYPIHPEE